MFKMLWATLMFLALLSKAEAGARILAQKSLNTQYFIVGQEFSVEYTIVNIGTDAAYFITLDDKQAFPSESFSVRGSLKPTFITIKPNERVTHAVMVTPLDTVTFDNKMTAISYTDSATNVHRKQSIIGASFKQYTVLAAERFMTIFNKSRSLYFVLFGVIAGTPTWIAASLQFQLQTRYEAFLIKKNVN